MTSKRLSALEKMAQGGSKDPFVWYALALEYKSAGRPSDALATFEALRGIDPAYVPMYLMCGQMLIDEGKPREARAWLEQGVLRARAKGDAHALSEMERALSLAESADDEADGGA